MQLFDWVLKPVSSPERVAELGRCLNNLPPALARALYLRGVQDFDQARHFFRGDRTALHRPDDMADLKPAVDRLLKAVRNRERVVVYGDYDVDGTTATAMVTHFLRTRGVPAAYFIPDRIRHGYGLCAAGIEEAVEKGAGLLLALDCGVTAVEEVALANSRGLDVVICDHHTPPEELPAAVAVLNPKRNDCAYPFSELCGCAVAYKLLAAVSAALGEPADHVEQYLDLVALATAADVVPLRGENRILLREGINQLRNTSRLGLASLADSARVSLEHCNARDIQFGLAPRINAAGRLGDAKRAVKLLLAEEATDAATRAGQLERVNVERRAMDKSVLESALERARACLEADGRNSVVLFDEGWHPGVLGIVAARLVDQLHRPTILLSRNGHVAKGSARSIPGVNIYNALHACRDLLTAFGGHDYAAGLSIAEENLPTFVDRFDAAVMEGTDPAVLRRKLELDAELDVRDVDQRFWAVLEQFEPFGAENEPPLFMSRGVKVQGTPRRAGRAGDHLKFRVAAGNASVGVIGFGLGDRFDTVDAAARDRTLMDLAFQVTQNEWNGVRSLQFRLKDLRLSGSGAGE